MSESTITTTKGRDWNKFLAPVAERFVADWNPEDEVAATEAVAALQAEFRTIPAASRFGAQTEAMLKVLMPAGQEVTEAFLNAVNNLPATTKARVAPVLTDEVVDKVRSAIVGRLEAITAEEVLSDLEEDLESDITTAAEAFIEKVLTKAVREAEKVKARNGSGEKVTYTESFADLVDGERLTIDDILTVKVGEATVEGTVRADGILVDGIVYESPTAAAKAAGIATSVNGMSAWKTAEGATIGSLRRA